MPVYLDLIWLLNVLFNSLLLLITGILLKREFQKKRVFFSGLIGSLLVFVPFLPLPSFFLAPWFKMGISIVMVWIAFGFKRFRFFFENLMMFYLSTFTAGGALIGTHYLLNFHFNIGDARFLTGIYGFGDPISWLFIIIGFPLALYFSKGVFNQFETLKIKTDQLVDVRIDINGKSVDLIGLVDTGNLLYDPISKKPVMIVSLEKTDHLFPPDLLPIFDDANVLAEQKGTLDEWMEKLTVIPFQSVGGKDRLIVAVKPNMVRIQKDGKTFETNRLYLAFVKQRLSSEDLFDCIVHPKLLAEKNERVS